MLAIGQLGGDILLQRSDASSIVDGLVLSGMRPGFIHPEVDYRNGAAHNVTPRPCAMRSMRTTAS